MLNIENGPIVQTEAERKIEAWWFGENYSLFRQNMIINIKWSLFHFPYNLRSLANSLMIKSRYIFPNYLFNSLLVTFEYVIRSQTFIAHRPFADCAQKGRNERKEMDIGFGSMIWRFREEMNRKNGFLVRNSCCPRWDASSPHQGSIPWMVVEKRRIYARNDCFSLTKSRALWLVASSNIASQSKTHKTHLHFLSADEHLHKFHIPPIAQWMVQCGKAFPQYFIGFPTLLPTWFRQFEKNFLSDHSMGVNFCHVGRSTKLQYPGAFHIDTF